MEGCRVHIKEERHCIDYQLQDWRRTPKGNLNVKFSCCVRPTPCDRWMTDEDFEAAGGMLIQARRGRCWGYGGTKNA